MLATPERQHRMTRFTSSSPPRTPRRRHRATAWVFRRYRANVGEVLPHVAGTTAVRAPPGAPGELGSNRRERRVRCRDRTAEGRRQREDWSQLLEEAPIVLYLILADLV